MVASITTVPVSRAVARPVKESTVARSALLDVHRNRVGELHNGHVVLYSAVNRTVSPTLTATDAGKTLGPIDRWIPVHVLCDDTAVLAVPLHPTIAATLTTTIIERISRNTTSS